MKGQTRAARAAHSEAIAAWRRGEGPRPPPRDRYAAAVDATARTEPAPACIALVPEQPPAVARRELPRARRICVFSDIHLPHPDPRAWPAVREFHRRQSFDWTILDGDVLDMCSAGQFAKNRDDPPHLLGEIEQFVAIVNEMSRETDRLTMVLGNHEIRFDKLVGSANPAALKGIKGLSLREVCEAHGLSKRVEWFRESAATPGIRVGSCIVRHGDRQAGRFGSVNPATTRLNKSMGVSEVVGHHHMAAIATRHAHGRSAFVVCNPCLAEMQPYAGSDTTWAHGFTILEVDQHDVTTPHLVLIQDGRFSWNGSVYGTREETP